MKNITYLLMSLLVIPFLACCNDGNNPPPPPVSVMYHLKVVGDHHCYVQGCKNAIYEQDFEQDRTDISIPLFIQDKYKINESQCVIPEGITLNNNLLVIAKMNQNFEVTIKSNHIEGYWFEFKGEHCQIKNSDNEYVSELKEFIQINDSEESRTYQLQLVDEALYIPIGDIQPGVIINKQEEGKYNLKLENIDRNYKVSLTAYSDNNLDMFLKVDLSDMVMPIYYFYCEGTNVVVDWGDGSEASSGSEGYFTHIYSESCVHKIFITGDNITYFSFSEDPYLQEAYLLQDITSISNHAFYNCQNLNSVVMTANVDSIGDSAFYNCISMLDFYLPDSITSIGDSAFYNCTQLTTLRFPSNLVTIKPNAFYNCTNIHVGTFPKNLESIGEYAFYNCNQITFIEFSEETDLSIDDYAFYGCLAIQKIFIPKNIISLGVNPFSACYGLMGINVDEDNLYYESPGITNGIIEKANHTLITGCAYTRIPDGVTRIGYCAFYGCWSLADIKVPQGISIVETAAFTNCENLESVTIPNSVTSFGANSFAYCYNLKKFDLTSYFDPNNLPSSAVGMFLYTHQDLTLYVSNTEMKEAFSKSGFWADYKIEVA